MRQHIKEIFKYMFSLSMLKSVLSSYAYYIHEHVAWRTQINAEKNIRIHPTASIRNAKRDTRGRFFCVVWLKT